MQDTANYAPINGAEIYYDVTGTGQPLVLVNSLLFDSTQWDDMIPALAQHFKVVRFDARGYGRTKTDDLKVADGDDLLTLLDYLKLDKIYLLGLSVGGETALEFTMRHPERVDALIMAGGGPLGWEDAEIDPREAEFRSAAKAGDYSLALDLFSALWVDGPISPATPAVRQRARQMMERYTWGHWQNKAAEQAASEAAKAEQGDAAAAPVAEQPAAEGPSYSELVAAIRTPVLFVAGERDQPMVLMSNEASAKVVPGAEAAVIPGAAHIIPLEQPDEFARVIIDFLQRRGGQAHGG